MKEKLTLLFVFALLLCGCKNESKHMEANPSKQYIGVASMEKDGTIVLQLRAELDDGANFGEGYFRYPTNDPEYQRILKHVGGLKPGESRNVPPWPEVKR